MTSGELGGRHPQVRRLRALNRDRATRAAEQAYVLEGPRVVAAALDRGAPLEGAYLGYRARPSFAPLVARLEASGVPLYDLREGVLEKKPTKRTRRLKGYAILEGGDAKRAERLLGRR